MALGSTSSAAATDESTPPDMATSTRTARSLAHAAGGADGSLSGRRPSWTDRRATTAEAALDVGVGGRVPEA